MMMNKIEGAYYTPRYLADFLVESTLECFQNREKLSVLEPSCGDGVFIESLLANRKFMRMENSEICCVEKNSFELEKVKKNKKNLKKHGIKSSFHNSDFLDFSLNKKEKFDLIIGNPPYIQKKLLNDEQIEKSKKIISEMGISINNISNIWIPFVISSIKMLKENGVFCFILPSEMLQVKYAEPIRNFILSEFQEIKLFSFDFRVFPSIEQDVIILMGIKKSEKNKVSHITLEKTKQNDNLINTKTVEIDKNKSFDKWLWYLLDNDEIDLINHVERKFMKISDVCGSGAGIVTGNNDYFILSSEDAKLHHLEEFTLPILKRSLFIKGTIKLTERDFKDIEQRNESCFLLNFNDLNTDQLPVYVSEYLLKGYKDNVHEGYKSKKRLVWYNVPSIWKSEGFIFKRSHLYPKILVNDADVYVTDTAYRIKMKDGFDIYSLVFSFYNSFTLLMAELKGRRYGGGVLEITPNEFKEIPLPYIKINNLLFQELDALFRNRTSIEDILNLTDNLILGEHFGLNNDEIGKLKNIRIKLVNNRLSVSS